MKRVLIPLSIGLALTATALSSTTASLTPAQALSDLNRWRAQAGEPGVLRFTAVNNSACALHTHYLRMLGKLVHPEQPGLPGYTRAGADAGVNSVLAKPGGLPKATWVDAVYHRMSILQPRLRVSGFAASEGYACLLTGGAAVDDSTAARTTTLTLYPWPPNGATHQPVTFGHAADETPSALSEAPGARSLGLLLSVNVNGPWDDHTAPWTKLTTASLVSDRGGAVPLALSDGSTRNASFLSGGFALFPRVALASGTGYTAHAAGKVTAEGVTYPFSLTWRFTTAAS